MPCRIIVLGQGDQKHLLRMYGIEYEMLWYDVCAFKVFPGRQNNHHFLR